MMNTDFPELVANQNGNITVTVDFKTGRMPSSQPLEILTLDEMSVKALQVSPTWTGRRDAHGNMLRWKAMYKSGAQNEAWHPFYDVYLKIAR